MHQSGTQALQKLSLTEHDRHLVARLAGHPVGAIDRMGLAEETHQNRHAPDEQHAADGDRSGERDCGGSRDYVPLAFLISAEIAGTTSCRSPITA